MESSRSNPDFPNPNPTSPVILIPSPSSPVWPTIDGPLGLSEEDSESYARRFYKFGFALLPLLWAVNCYYFWPALRHPRSFPRVRHYVLRSAVGCALSALIISAWAITFSVGGERLFGHAWDEMLMYNLADKIGLTGWS